MATKKFVVPRKAGGESSSSFAFSSNSSHGSIIQESTSLSASQHVENEAVKAPMQHSEAHVEKQMLKPALAIAKPESVGVTMQPNKPPMSEQKLQSTESIAKTGSAVRASVQCKQPSVKKRRLEPVVTNTTNTNSKPVKASMQCNQPPVKKSRPGSTGSVAKPKPSKAAMDDDDKENVKPPKIQKEKNISKPEKPLTDQDYDRIFDAVLVKLERVEEEVETSSPNLTLTEDPAIEFDETDEPASDSIKVTVNESIQDGNQPLTLPQPDQDIQDSDKMSSDEAAAPPSPTILFLEKLSQSKASDHSNGKGEGSSSQGSTFVGQNNVNSTPFVTPQKNLARTLPLSQEQRTPSCTPTSAPSSQTTRIKLSQEHQTGDGCDLSQGREPCSPFEFKVNSTPFVTPQKNITRPLSLSQEPKTPSCTPTSASSSQSTRIKLSQVQKCKVGPAAISNTPSQSQEPNTPLCTPNKISTTTHSNKLLSITNTPPPSPSLSSQLSQTIQLTPPPSGLTARERLQWLHKKRQADGLWVHCDEEECGKWRYLPDCHDPSTLPSKWCCSMHPDEDQNHCSAPERRLNLHAEEDMIYNKYSPGSLVWAKLSGYPWWPAMVEDDPDLELFYWLNLFSDIPTWYHVVFFDEKERSSCLRGWVQVERLKDFADKDIVDEDGEYRAEPLGYEKRIRAAYNRAMAARKLNNEDRLAQFSFASCYKGPIGGQSKTKYDGPLGYRKPVPK